MVCSSPGRRDDSSKSSQKETHLSFLLRYRRRAVMSPSSRHSIDSFTYQLHTWRPFHYLQTTIDSSSSDPPLSNNTNNNAAAAASNNTIINRSSSNGGSGVHCSYTTLTKRPCLSDRTTSFPPSSSSAAIDSIDFSKLSLFDDDKAFSPYHRGSLSLLARKRRRRRGSRSVSGRSSDRSGTRRCCSVGASAAHGTCSDFPVAIGTDSSGELFGGNGEVNWASDVSEAKNSTSRDREENKENLGAGYGQFGNLEAQGNDSGYGSEPGYRGDAEFGYGDEVDEEEEDARPLFWGYQFGDTDSELEIVGENKFSDQKAHHRCRRKKHDCRMVDSLR